ncbi:GTPase IMAP family member 8-like isoform X3 [Elgaria multicarinata webbii]|uniref:GTPase IMAP family member 8-like isoform X3 n=1 Tax=Elgaria multicarinata webbii TaxID=159646 RepID=UPI002FCCC54C
MAFGKRKAEPRNVCHNREDQELRIILVGRTGGGKSATGNTILGEKTFESQLSQKPVTQTCQREERQETWKGKQVIVIDTPAIFDNHVQEPWVSQEIQKCFSLCEPGPHALVFVTQVGRFTEEDNVAVKRVEEIFGHEAMKYMTVLFTRKEDLGTGKLKNYIKQSDNRSLQDLVKRCQDHYCSLNNKATGNEMNTQVDKLLHKLVEMMQGNLKKPYLEFPRQTKRRSIREAGEELESYSEKPATECEKRASQTTEKSKEEEWQLITTEPRKVFHNREDQELRIILVGKSGGGKSATGNTILGEKTFESQLSQKPVTQTCQREERQEKWKGKQVIVIDTPAIFDNHVQEPWVSQEIQKCFSLCEPGPHALVFVAQVGRFTEEDNVAVKRVEEIFGHEATKNMTVLFTRKEDLGTLSLEDYVKQSDNRSLQDLVMRCQNRHCAFNNKEAGEESILQAEQLLDQIEKTVPENCEKPPPKGLSVNSVEWKAEEGQTVRREGSRGCWEKDPKEERSDEGAPEPETQSLKDPEIRIVLVGKTGAGKSATGNTILGMGAFEAGIQTESCHLGIREWKGRRAVLIDTPAFFDLENDTAKNSPEAQHCLCLSRPGPHVLVLVVRSDHHTKEDEKAIEWVRKIFGSEAMKYTIIVFTRRDLNSRPLKECLSDPDYTVLQSMTNHCNGRWCSFNNEEAGGSQVEELLSKVEEMVQENQYGFLSTSRTAQLPRVPPRKTQDETEVEEEEQTEMLVAAQEAADLGGDGCLAQGPELRIVLVGKTGSGKSAAGNVILGSKIFNSCPSSSSITAVCGKQETYRNGRKIVVVDTPGFFDTKYSTNEVTCKEVKRCVTYSSPGPHAIIQVVQLGRFSEEEKAVAQLIQDVFSLRVKAYMIILFSRKEDLQGKSLWDFISNGDKDLKEQVAQCGGRCFAFNNKAEGQEKEAQVSELLQMIDALVEQNRSAPCYTEEMLNNDQAEAIQMFQRSRPSQQLMCNLF